VLHVDGVDGVLRVDVARGDVLRAVADLERAAVEAAQQAHALDPHVAYARAAVVAGDGDGVAPDAEGHDVAHDSALDVHAVRRGHQHAVPGAVGEMAALDAKAAAVDANERAARILRDGG